MHDEQQESPTESSADRLESSNGDKSMADWLDEYCQYRSLQRGDIISGRVVHIAEDGIMIDVGAKTEGIVSQRELERMDPEAVSAIEVGEEVLVYVITPEDKDGNILLSLAQAQLAQDWKHAQTLYDKGEIFQATITGHNKGGLIVYLGKVRGFVPASQLDRRRRGRLEESDAAQPWADIVGKPLWLKVIEVDPYQNRLILSEQAAMRQRRRGQREQLLERLTEGDVVTGEVTSLADFGAFVDLGGADGLIHISELSWERISHPSDVLTIGDEVEVQVISLDRERRRIGLSLKRLQPEPWETVEDRFQVGDLVEGTITKLTNFGAFARINGGIEGLIHISELADQMIHHPSEVVREGDVLTLRVIRIESERRRIGLSLKQVDRPDVLPELEISEEE